MKIKVCGLKDPDNIKAVAALSPDYMGFINYDQTPRFIGELSPEALSGLTLYKTGVFVNEKKETIEQLISRYRFNAIQLHGNESADFCKILKSKASVIKAFGVDENFDFEQLNTYTDSVDYFLFDAKTSLHGGSGKTFNWHILQRYKLNVPFFLSGGISIDNLAEIEKIKHPALYGVDLNSRFETEPGVKNIELLQKAFNLLRQPVTQ